MAVAANAHGTLRISPAVIGSTAAGAEQVIALDAVQALQPHARVLTVAKPQLIQAQPIVKVQTLAAQPIIKYTHSIAQPLIKTLVAPTVYQQAQPVIKYVQHVQQPQQLIKYVQPAQQIVKYVAAPVEQPIIKIAAPVEQPIIKVAQPVKYTTTVAEEHHQPQPYAFGFNSVDEQGATHERQESKDANGVVTGSYTIQDTVTGAHRIVNYVADAEGFRASIQSNEPGMITSNPAGVQIQATNQGNIKA